MKIMNKLFCFCLTDIFKVVQVTSKAEINAAREYILRITNFVANSKRNTSMRNLIFLFLIVLLISCSKSNQEIGFQSMREISKEYTNTGFLDSIDNYRYIFSIKCQNDLEIQLWGKKENQNVVVYIYHDLGYAIPLLPNYYKKYWGFQFDNNETDISNIKATISSEYLHMLAKLRIMDSVKISYTGLLGLIHGIIPSRLVHISDSTDIMDEMSFGDYNLGESDSICRIRKYKILGSVYKEIRKFPYVFFYNTYWDEKNNRIYQINFDSMRINKRFIKDLKIYRLDCNINQIKM